MITSKSNETKQFNKSVATKVAEVEYNKINNLVNAGLFISTSDFVREAIRDKLKSIDIIELRDIPKEQAKQEIYEYCKEHKRASLSEIADDLLLDVFEVNDILSDLIENGNLKEVE